MSTKSTVYPASPGAQSPFEIELENHLETWGPHCGAPLGVYAGHLRILLLSAQIDELERLGKWVRDEREYDRQDSIDEIARAIENRCRSLEAMKRR
jgi:hypothetical protein